MPETTAEAIEKLLQEHPNWELRISQKFHRPWDDETSEDEAQEPPVMTLKLCDWDEYRITETKITKTQLQESPEILAQCIARARQLIETTTPEEWRQKAPNDRN